MTKFNVPVGFRNGAPKLGGEGEITQGISEISAETMWDIGISKHESSQFHIELLNWKNNCNANCWKSCSICMFLSHIYQYVYAQGTIIELIVKY